MIATPQKDVARVDLFDTFLMINRCNSACRFDYMNITNTESSIFTGFIGTVFKNDLYNDVNSVQMNYCDERDFEKINSSLYQLVREVSKEELVFQR